MLSTLFFRVFETTRRRGAIFETTRHTNRLIDVIVESHEGRFCPTLSYPHFARPIREGAKRALSRSARPGSRVPGPGAMAGASSQGELDWGFSQVFGERTPGEEVQDGACGRDRVESRRCGGFYATRWETRAPRERARSPETLATRAARVSRTGRRRRDATLAFPATTPRAAAARPPSNARPARRFRRPFPPPIARNADVRLSRACSSFPFASLFT